MINRKKNRKPYLALITFAMLVMSAMIATSGYTANSSAPIYQCSYCLSPTSKSFSSAEDVGAISS